MGMVKVWVSFVTILRVHGVPVEVEPYPAVPVRLGSLATGVRVSIGWYRRDGARQGAAQADREQDQPPGHLLQAPIGAAQEGA